jgi:hypothetical protein
MLQCHLGPQVAQRLSDPSYYGALCLLVDEAGFLIDSKAAALIAQLPPSEGQLVAAEAIVRSLGVSDGPAFDALIDALSADGGAGAADRAALSLSGEGKSEDSRTVTWQRRTGAKWATLL